MLAQLLTRPMTIRRRTAGETDDGYGNAVSTVTEVEVLGEIQQRQRGENDTELSTSDWLLALPAGTDIDTDDSVAVDGLGTFELVGEPWPVRNPRTGVESHVEATVRRTAAAGDA